MGRGNAGSGFGRGMQRYSQRSRHRQHSRQSRRAARRTKKSRRRLNRYLSNPTRDVERAPPASLELPELPSSSWLPIAVLAVVLSLIHPALAAVPLLYPLLRRLQEAMFRESVPEIPSAQPEAALSPEEPPQAPVEILPPPPEPALKPEDLQVLEASTQAQGLCAYCNDALDELGPQDTVVRCRRCQTPHHRSCWREAGICSTYACGGKKTRPI